jgi:predicted  nucleic acid-binding Zn-ribbon protein
MVEPLSVTGIVLEVGTVAWKLGQFCFQYAQSVKRAEKEVDALLGQIHNFHTALRRLKSMLEEEEERAGSLVGDDRLKNLRDVMAEESLSLKTCRDNLRSLQDKISKGETGRLLSRAKIVRDEEDAMRIWRNLRWPFKQDEVKRMMDNMREVAQQIDRARDNDAL